MSAQPAQPATPEQPAQPVKLRVIPQVSLQRRQLLRIVIAVAIAAAAGGYLIADLHHNDLLPWLPRSLAIVASVALLVLIVEIRLARQVARESASVRQDLAHIIQRLEHRLATAEVAEAYVDGLQRRLPENRHLHSV